MTVRVSPTEPKPTHHFSLQDKSGTRLGLTLCDENGVAKSFKDPNVFIKQPVDTTANKQTSGSSSYEDYQYPYNPIAQNDLSGGRGNLDHEKDSTKYWDSFRCQSGRAGKAYAGPLEQYVSGLRNSSQTVPLNVTWVPLRSGQAIIYKAVALGASLTANRIWLLLRRAGKPKPMIVEIRQAVPVHGGTDMIGALLQTFTITNSQLPDLTSDWVQSETTVGGGTKAGYTFSGDVFIVLKSNTGSGAETGDDELNHWKVAVNRGAGTSYYSPTYTTAPTRAAPWDLIYRILDAPSNKTCISFEYLEQQYFVISSMSGAPKLYQAGDRGLADWNASALTKLKDATKSWETNEWAGSVVMLVDGPGFLEPQNWRTIISNTDKELIVNSPWKIAHTQGTHYVILGTKISEITGHGLTAPITSVYASTEGIVYFCQGDAVVVRRMREYNDSGTWKREWADEGTTKARFMVYKPLAKKIVIGNNSDTGGRVSIREQSNATVPVWGTALAWAAVVEIDNQYRKITGMIVYPDEVGKEAVWVMKTDMVFSVTSSGVTSVNIEEMRTVRSDKNGVRPIKHGLYLYFPLLQGLERYYGGQVDDVGPNREEGLPNGRQGPIVAMASYPGKFYIAINAGGQGYSSILHSGGWHEIYRAPKGEQIKDMFFQVSPGGALDRLWVYQGDDLVWLPFPSETTNELDDEAYLHTYEFAVTLSRMHASLYDVQKLVKKIKLHTEALEKSAQGIPVCWFEVDYRLNEDTEWTTIPEAFVTSPHQEWDFTPVYGIAGKRIQFRLRGYTTNATKTPVLLAIIIGAVVRVNIKSLYGPFTFMIMKDEPVSLRENDPITAENKLSILENWGDANNDSMLLMRSVSKLCDNKMIFLNVGTRRQVKFEGMEFKSNVYTVGATMQEA